MESVKTPREIILKFGRYQKLMAALIGIISFIDSMPIFSTVFTAASPDLNCYLESDVNKTTKLDKKCDIWKQIQSNGENASLYRCEFDDRYYGSTIVTDWLLVCDNQYLVSLTQTFYLAGTFSAFFVGYFSDTYGRRKVSLVIYVLFCAAQIVNQFFQLSFFPFSWLTRYIIYSVAQFIIGFTANGLFNVTYTLLFELVAAEYVQLVSNINLCLYVTGEIAVNIVALISRDWEVVNWFVAAFSTLVLVFCFVFLPESPQYLVEKRKEKELAQFLRRVARVNNMRVDVLNDDHIDMEKLSADEKSENNDTNSSSENKSILKTIFATKTQLMKISFLGIIWFGLSMVYYGVSLGITSVGDNINPYLIFALSSVSEFIGYLICYINDKIGHKKTFVGFLGLASITCLAVSLIQLMSDSEDDSVDLKTVLLIVFTCIGKAMASAAFNSAYVYTSEMFDTRVRNTLLLLVACFGRIGSVISPQINLLGDLVLKQLPYLIFSIFSFIACVLIIILPNPFALKTNMK